MQQPPLDTETDRSVPGKLAFVLSGGGSLGSVQVGCLEVLLGHGIVPELIVGTSVGALNGVFLAKSPTVEGVAELRDLWLESWRKFNETRRYKKTNQRRD